MFTRSQGTRQRDAGRSVSVELKNDTRIAQERVTEAMEKIPRKPREKEQKGAGKSKETIKKAVTATNDKQSC